ncbi:chemotaxis protein CheW [Methylobacterium sp. 77]|uniref:chemotaxis protein CheW n=1 Tax=Methylobacterium sp. 77 TaxID=1101192 RepID=UPI00039F8093|nr:chemotaxis protein CheW [Methylobacterium sp. 77]
MSVSPWSYDTFSSSSGRRNRSRPLPQPETTAYLILDVSGVTFAMLRASVSEVLPLPHLHPPTLPGTLLAGFLNLGGGTVPVIDLRRLLALPASLEREGNPYRHLLLAADRRTALLVDRVSDLTSIDPASLRALAADASLNGCVTGEIAQGESVIQVLDMERLLNAEEHRRVQALADAAAVRLSDLARLEGV